MSRFLLAAALLCVSAAFAFDHTYAQYQTVLDKHVRDGSVNYSELLHDRAALDSFVASCGEVTFEQYRAFTKNEKLAYPINLYNAATMQLVIDHWPVASVQDIGGLFSSPWNKKFIRMFDHMASLGMIEHDILRADFDEPRIHFAIVCASRGCPLLRGDAYADSKMRTQLAEQERGFLTARPDCNRFENGTLYLSPIFKWYRPDFNNDDGIRTLLQLYYPEITKTTRIEYTDYDWSLNGQ
ncbi:MAG: DUF547 domain-containing protein [bacterium]|nr:DUF547 domain-containing protein [bacterium]